jgi:hypothetical protein
LLISFGTLSKAHHITAALCVDRKHEKGHGVATYEDTHHVRCVQHPAFQEVYPASARTPLSGIYRCDGCGRECVSIHYRPLPPEGHHQHTPSQGPIRWRLLVYADYEPKP